MQKIEDYPESSRIWIYQADRELIDEELPRIEEEIVRFVDNWTSHRVDLEATGGLLYNRFLVLAVNEKVAGVSGCSIDASVQFVRNLGATCSIDFLNRLNFAYLDSDSIREVHKDDLKDLYVSGKINDETLFFDNLVQTKSDFVRGWKKPLGESWMKRFV